MLRHRTRTFLDSGVLITANRGLVGERNAALEILEDPDRIFLSSPFLQHEVCPKALFNHRQQEYRFYLEYFQRTAMLNDVRLILEHAGHESARAGLGAMDSLHVTAAHLSEADEFIATETPKKSIYRTKLVRVLYLFR